MHSFIWSSKCFNLSQNYFRHTPSVWFRAAQDSCTRAMHCGMCRLDWRTCTPHHTVAGRSSISLTQSPFPFPSATAATNPLSATCRAVPLHPYALASRQMICLSHMPGRAVASYARVQAELHTSSHTVRCARLVQLWLIGFRPILLLPHHNRKHKAVHILGYLPRLDTAVRPNGKSGTSMEHLRVAI
jgi:hypothetical protein